MTLDPVGRPLAPGILHRESQKMEPKDQQVAEWGRPRPLHTLNSWANRYLPGDHGPRKAARPPWYRRLVK
jgi:hypothetical protein